MARAVSEAWWGRSRVRYWRVIQYRVWARIILSRALCLVGRDRRRRTVSGERGLGLNPEGKEGVHTDGEALGAKQKS